MNTFIDPEQVFWEYHSVTIQSDIPDVKLLEQLNLLGLDGWELLLSSEVFLWISVFNKSTYKHEKENVKHTKYMFKRMGLFPEDED